MFVFPSAVSETVRLKEISFWGRILPIAAKLVYFTAFVPFMCSQGAAGLDEIAVHVGEEVRFNCEEFNMRMKKVHAVEVLLLKGRTVVFEYDEGFQRKTNKTNHWHFEAVGLGRDKVGGRRFSVNVWIPRAKLSDSGKYTCLVRYSESQIDNQKSVDIANVVVFENGVVEESSEPKPLPIPEPYDPWASERYSITASSVFGMAFFILVCVIISLVLVLIALPQSILSRLLRPLLRYTKNDADREQDTEENDEGETNIETDSIGYIPPPVTNRSSKGNLVVVMDDSYMGSYSVVQ